MSEKMPYLKLEGTPHEMGFMHGRTFSERIQQCYDFYTKVLIRNKGFDFEDYGNRYFNVITEDCPAYGDEIRGIAEGSGLSVWQIAVLNARTEVFLWANAKMFNECTSLHMKEGAILGQTWDWMRPCEDFMVLLDINQPDGHRVMTITEAGILGKIGMNSSGLGVCLNILVGKESPIAVPVHILLRKALDSRSLADALNRLKATNFGTFSNVLIGDKSGNRANLEFLGQEMRTVEYDDDLAIHTNHYLSESRETPGDPQFLNSKVRFTRATELKTTIEDATVDEMKRLLLDQAGGSDAICKAYGLLPEPFSHIEHGTNCILVMDLVAGEFSVTRGNPYDHPFQIFQLSEAD